jgi:hypothetical protein
LVPALEMTVGAIEMLFVRSAPTLPTLAHVDSSLDSVADTEGAGVLGAGLIPAGDVDTAGGVLFVKARVTGRGCADGGGL